MPHTRSTRRSAYIVPLVFGLAVLPLLGLMWAIYFLFAQERALEQGRRRERLSRTADLIASELQRALSDAERLLIEGQQSWPDGAVAATFHHDHLVVKPAGRIAYLPVPERLPEADAGSGASSLLLAASRLLADGSNDEAWQMFGRLLDEPPFLVGDAPSIVAARYARCLILERTGRTADLREEAARLGADMHSFGPYLTDAAYELYAENVGRWTEAPMPDAPVAVSAALEMLWERWAANRLRPATSGRELINGSGEVLALWQVLPDRLAALVVPGDFRVTAWAAPAEAVAREHDATIVALTSLSASIADGPGQPGDTFTRAAGRDGLPWAITVAPLPASSDAPFRQRRAILVASFLTLALMMGAASYAIVRSVSRELAVARLQSDFVSAVSHEFRTPLTALKQFVEVLREQPALSEAQRRQCYDAQARAVDRLSRLVESVLDFGRIEAGTRPYRLEPHDGGALVHAVVAEFNHHAEHAGYRASVEGGSTAIVQMDPEAVSRALWNLLDNAMKYSPDDKVIRVSVQTASDSVRIEVIDRGIGIAASESSDVFKRFHRGADVLSRGIPGTGIGLAMVSEIMRAHGGSVELESRPGAGSTFTLVFPLTV